MSHRIKNPQLHLEGPQHSDYLNKLLRKENKPSSVKPLRPLSGTSRRTEKQSSSSTTRPQSPSMSNQLAKIRSNVKQQNLDLIKHHGRSVVHKESISDNSALVEVTVKAKKRHKSRSNSASDREPWDHILKANTVKENSMFSSFDPLRTIHFLAKELKYKLENVVPDDNNVLQMVSDMQQALKRIPPEVASTIQLKQCLDSKWKKTPSGQVLTDEEPERLIVIKPSTVEKTCQTPALPSNEAETAKIQKLMEDSTVKLETSCRQMEMLCGRLKSEKNELELQLKNERESVQFLKKRVDYLEHQNENFIHVEMKTFEEQKNTLESQIEQLKRVLEQQRKESSNVSEEFNYMIQELKSQKAKIEEDYANLKREHAILKLEKEKYLALLSLRDQQISEIRTEMDQLQQVINEQLRDLNSNAMANIPSAESLATDSEAWIYEDAKDGLKSSENFLSRMSEDNSNLELIRKPPSSFRELPSGDSESIGLIENCLNLSPRNSQKVEKASKSSSKKASKDSHASIRDMFAEIRKQAYSVASAPEQVLSHRYTNKSSTQK